MRWHAFRAALRIARRDALRARGRSALVVAMVALPVLAVAAAAVLAATTTGTAAWRADSVLGAGTADALVDLTAGQPVLQAPDPYDGWMSSADGSGGATAEPATGADTAAAASPTGGIATATEPPPAPTRAQQVARVRALLPAGSRVLTMDSATARMQRADGGATRAEVVELDYADPIGRGLVTQLAGRAPRTPDEVALTDPLARTTGLGIGDRLRLTDADRTLTVVGIVRKPRPWDARAAYTLPGAVLDALPPDTSSDGPPQPHAFTPVFLVDTPAPLDWPDVQRLNAAGALVTSRAVLLDPPPDADVPFLAQAPRSSNLNAQSVAMLVVVVGMTLLEVVLLAGPAFAVGARQRRRQLALVAATGGSRGHVRDVVLAGGVVLGLTAGLLGAGLGVLAAWAARPLAERLAGHDYGPLVVPVGQVLGVAAVGALTAVLAAVVPAWQASRLDVVAALAGRRGQVRTPRRVPAVGALLAVVGGAGAAYGAWGHSAVEILAGSMVAEIGLVLCTPTLVGWAGRLAPYLPLSGRLALRDASRHRLRSAPAVAAVMAAVAGSVAIGSYLASQDRHNAFEYVPSALPGQIRVSDLGGDSLDAAVRAVTSVVPVADRQRLRSLALGCPGDGPCTVMQPWIPDENACPDGAGRTADDFRCRTVPNALFQRQPLVVAAEDLRAVIGASDAAAERVLRDGGVLVADRRLLHDGKVTLQLSDPARDGAPRSVDVPGAMQPREGAVLVRAIVSPGAVARTHAATQVDSVVLTPAAPVSADEQQRAEDAITAIGTPSVQLTVERGYQSREGAGLLALAVAAGVVTLGAAAVATGLALADARPDLTTLAAVGASPGVRRRLAGAQAAVIAVLGTALGVPAGIVPAAAVVWALGHAAGSGAVVDPLWRLAFPWQTVGVAAVLVPVIAVLGTALLVRARLPLERRAA